MIAEAIVPTELCQRKVSGGKGLTMPSGTHRFCGTPKAVERPRGRFQRKLGTPQNQSMSRCQRTSVLLWRTVESQTGNLETQKTDHKPQGV